MRLFQLYNIPYVPIRTVHSIPMVAKLWSVGWICGIAEPFPVVSRAYHSTVLLAHSLPRPCRMTFWMIVSARNLGTNPAKAVGYRCYLPELCSAALEWAACMRDSKHCSDQGPHFRHTAVTSLVTTVVF